MRLSLSVLTLSALAWSVAQAEMVTQEITYRLDDTEFRSTLVYDDAVDGQRPGIVMVPNWMGPTPESLEKAKMIAGEDYVVLMADMYGVDVRPENSQEASQAAGAVRSDRELMRRRVNKAVDVLLEQSGSAPIATDHLAAIGFCFGGGTVLELARSGNEQVDAVVSFHGNLDTPNPEDAENIQAKVLVLHGAEDPFVKQEQVQDFVEEMRGAGEVDWQLVQFSNTVHSFTDPNADSPGQAQYHPRSARRAYRMMNALFADTFQD